jgi:diguanylate cyclase (GGDEF)-like protein/PAS domain S-box-containing protein
MDAHHCNSTPARDDASDRAHASRDFSTLFDFLPIGAYRSTPQGQLLCANPALVQLNGYATEAELIAAIHDIGSECYVTPQARQRFCEALERDGFVRSFITEAYRHKTRERVWVNENAHMVRDAQGRAQFYEGTVEDITERRQNQARITERAQAATELRQRDEIWKLALESTGDGVWDWNIGQNTAVLSQRCQEMYGYGAQALHAQLTQLDERTHPDDLAQMLRDRQAHLDGVAPAYVNEHRVRCADGSWKWILTRGMVISRSADGTPLRMVGTHTDITQRKENEALIWHQAHFDALTGLPNRRMLHDRLAQQMLLCDRHREHEHDGKLLAVLFIDLDHFKEVNDTLGHAGGDRLLVEAAQRLTRCVRATDTVARMGGDEFAIVQVAITQPADATTLAHRIIEVVSKPYDIEGQRIDIGASIGIAMAPTDGDAPDDLLRNSDLALYRAKGDGRGTFCFFEPDMDAQMQARRALEYDLRRAVPAKEFELHYQPVIDLKSNQISSFEALVRWRHPSNGLVPPGLFIPLAEKLGVIIALGEWAIRDACVTASSWSRELSVAVNISPSQFRHAGLVQIVADALEHSGLPAHRLELDITEPVLMGDSEAALSVLHRLRALGVKLAMDDFGTGYASLSYLHSFAFDKVKIDRSFVRSVAADSGCLNVVRAVTAMAHSLGMSTTAEGVETLEQLEIVRTEACTEMQGFLFSPALPASEIDKILKCRIRLGVPAEAGNAA